MGPTKTPTSSRTHVRASQWALGASALVGTIMFVVLWRTLAVFAISGDDFALVLNSARPYVGLKGMAAWFTSGYSHYFDNYPGWAPAGTSFVRPLINAFVWLESLAVPIVGERAYLIANWVALAVSVFLLTLVLVRYAGLDARLSAAVAVGMGLTPLWWGSLTSPSFGTNTIALALSLAALVMLDPSAEPQWQRVFAASLLLTLAVAAHETALVGVVVCAVLFWGYSPATPRAPVLAWFGIPLGFFLVERALLKEHSGTYALGLTGADVINHLKHALAGPVIPYDPLRFLTARLTRITWFELVVWAVCVIANYAIVAGIVIGARSDQPLRRRLSAVIALTLTLPFVVLIDAEPRFMGITFGAALIAVMSLIQQREWLRVTAVALLVVACAAVFAEGFAPYGSAIASNSEFDHAYYLSIRSAILERHPRMVVLVNDPVGLYGSRAMLEMAAWPRHDVHLVVIDNYRGPLGGAEYAGITASRGHLSVSTRFSAQQTLEFDGSAVTLPTSQESFTYVGTMATTTGLGSTLRAEGSIETSHTLVVGADPRDGSILRPISY